MTIGLKPLRLWQIESSLFSWAAARLAVFFSATPATIHSLIEHVAEKFVPQVTMLLTDDKCPTARPPVNSRASNASESNFTSCLNFSSNRARSQRLPVLTSYPATAPAHPETEQVLYEFFPGRLPGETILPYPLPGILAIVPTVEAIPV